jgi:type II secretory pathway pseudopilin PulG
MVWGWAMLPVLHASGFNWDEAVVLVVAVLAVPALSWVTGRVGQRRAASAQRATERREERLRQRQERRHRQGPGE